MTQPGRDGSVHCLLCGREHAFHAPCVPAAWRTGGAVLPPPSVPIGAGPDQIEARAVADALRSAATAVERLGAGRGGS